MTLHYLVASVFSVNRDVQAVVEYLPHLLDKAHSYNVVYCHSRFEAVDIVVPSYEPENVPKQFYFKRKQRDFVMIHMARPQG